MNDIIQAIILGAVQGLTEFLPVSSSAHLVLFPRFLGWEYKGLSYDVMLHMGTLGAVVSVFWRDWLRLVKDGFARPAAPEGRGLWLLVLATVPAGLAGILLEDLAENVFRGETWMAVNLALFAGVMWFADRRAGGVKSLADLTVKSALLIGLFQALAIMPGASRSGVTITAALLLGFSRAESARVSFLLSTPIILGAGLLEGFKLGFGVMDPATIAGFLSAFATGWAAISFLMRYLRTNTLLPFVVYRALLAGLICLSFRG
ncbi:MAG TPA: undecaprenyl-diphosphate phosphatase [Elusimicrobiales bacterium]|nr:undecaprenyl-diphosphate phosphatase [Elusimicrobiales bacterium]